MENRQRPDNRAADEIRPITISYNTFGYAHASVLFELGQTKVLASVTLQQGVPPFLKGQKVGWLSAEYAMLPAATHQRTSRESLQGKQNSRSVEISRLIGRCLRTTIDLSRLGERTIIIDCDVLQADGGTRVASITAASLALEKAVQLWLNQKLIDTNILRTRIAAISVGLVNGLPCSDLCYLEDSNAEADFNFVMTAQGDLIEIQGTSEKSPISWNNFEVLKALAMKGITTIFDQCAQQSIKNDEQMIQHGKQPQISAGRPNHKHLTYEQKPGIFSLANRLNKAA